MTVEEAKEVCDALWMKEALDRLVDRLSASCQKQNKEEVSPFFLS